MKTPENSGLPEIKRSHSANRPRFQPRRIVACTAIAAVLLAGCASNPVDPPAPTDVGWLLSGQALFEQPVPRMALPEDDILGLSPEMRRYLAHVAPQASPQQRLAALLQGFENRDFTVQYQADQTLTASGTYREQVGNCMAFTVMMVAMARELGADAYFNQVEVPPVWGHEESQTFVVYRHINMVSESPRGRRVVDFNLEAYDPIYDQRRLSDTEAFAQYYSNRGLELMQQAQMVDAFRYLRKALDLKPGDADLWANLGALYSRNRAYGAAEQSYQQALQLKSNHTIAMSNLERLYRKQSKFDLADHYAEKARFHRERNPYYLYYQARTAYEHGDYKSAKKQLKRAIWQYEDDHRFHFLMGLTSFKLGDVGSSKSHFYEAFSLVDSPGTLRAYNKKLSYLLNSPPK
ncbi:tetratricopeptide repeat protein [Microbulbifer elongatus]|uniref:Tetratricopeptide repeat protein n=1 Tax=Microbulbifer elongatus TaxID=86173 RepID=A0ABT1NWZ7_9GAMM|nr:CDC27 family protein [Microbulbifer elongatus]MCQ3828420.1 tetratricopeptide repeat protein [Microbulbifer elongatus]